MTYQVLVFQLCVNFSLVLIAKRLFLQIGAKKGAVETRACSIFGISNSAYLCHFASHAACHSENSFLLLPSPHVSNVHIARKLDLCRNFKHGDSQVYPDFANNSVMAYRIYSINRPGRLLNFRTLTVGRLIEVGAYSRLGAY